MTRLVTDSSLAQPTKFLDDPLTPFDVDVNSSTGLIQNTPQLSEENIRRLQYLRFDDGFTIGTTVGDSKNLFTDTEGKGDSRKIIFQHVPGLVYKWKSGIVTETLNINVDRPLNGLGNSLQDVLSTQPITTAASAFANLDAADVLSILVTGQPYNYGNFLRNSIDMGTFSVDNVNNTKFYFNYLFDLFERNRKVMGNFIPAKNSAINPRDAILAFSAKKSLTADNQKLSDLQSKLAKLEDQAKTLATNGITSDAGISKLIADIQSKIASVQSKMGSQFGDVTLNAVGNDILLNIPDENIDELNKKIKYTIKRKPEEVRYNTDKNFFIVSSQYDQDTDIQAFATALKSQSPNLMSSTYKTPYDLAVMTAGSLNFELFIDPNGNIVFRPPEYNKTPLSLLLKMINLSRGDGTNLAPKFVVDLFSARANTVEDRLLQIELQILKSLTLLRIQPIQLNIYSLLKDPLLVNSSQLTEEEVALQTAAQTKYMVPFFLDKSTAALDKAINERGVATPSLRNSFISSQTMTTVDKVKLESELTTLARVTNQLNSINGTQDLITDSITALGLVEEFDKFAPSNAQSSTNRLNELNNLSSLISQRQLLLQTYNKLLINQQYYSDADDTLQRVSLENSWRSWTAALSGNPDVPQLPQVLKDLVENDLANDDGPRSGKRFIIMDDVILDMKFNITTPQFNRITVSGNSDSDNIHNLDAAAPNSIPNYYDAKAVDFDSWRKYGLRELTQPFHRVDFNNAETQCAPYAVFKLLEQRKLTHGGQITVIGNEFYQPGDVVYVNCKSLLYYVTKVSHSMDLSTSRFVTTLDLNYGRALGEYIPTPLDIIGKGMLATQRKAYGNIVTKRTSIPSASIFVLETLFDHNYLGISSDTYTDTNLQHNIRFFEENKDKIKNTIIRAASKINSSNNESYRIELRGYYIKPSTTADKNAPNIKDTYTKTQTLLDFAYSAFSTVSSIPELRGKIDTKNIVKIAPIDITSNKELSEDDRNFRRFPSNNAWAMANQLIDFDGLGLPLNAIDVVFVVDKSKRGDK